MNNIILFYGDEEATIELSSPHEDNTTEIFKCVQCDFIAQSKRGLVAHTNHSHNANILRCVECSFKTIVASKLELHRQTHNGGYTCSREDCAFASASLTAYQKHIKTHDCDPIRGWVCCVCNYSTRNYPNFLRHQGKHDTTKKVKCKHCSFTSHLQGLVADHENRHTGTKPFKCPQCPMAFASRVSVFTHNKIMHQEVSERKFKCAVCNYRTDRRDRFEAHERYHEGNLAFHCTQCAFNSADPCSLKIHVNSFHSTAEHYRVNFSSSADESGTQGPNTIEANAIDVEEY